MSMAEWIGLLSGVWVVLTGACVGSFLNVCIYRMPLGRSIIRPRSHCAACGTALPWKYNLPVLSWLILRGRAACCGTKIDVRYPLVESLTAAGCLALWWLYPAPLWIIYSIFFCGLVVATFVDIDHFIIPDEISLGGLVVGLVLSTVFPELQGVGSFWQGFLWSLAGAVLGGGTLYLISWIGSAILKKEAMGMGDVKLLAAMGAFLGWQSPFFIIAVSSVIGSVFGIFLLFRKRKAFGVRMPFGPYLALAGVLWLLGGREWMARYFIAISEF
jgi:leader peptidase (prepilin peptidase)/N-methyltransferase